jgi:hypothetical protein
MRQARRRFLEVAVGAAEGSAGPSHAVNAGRYVFFAASAASTAAAASTRP